MFSVQALSVFLFHRLTELSLHLSVLTMSRFALMYLKFPSAKIQSETTFENRNPRATARKISNLDNGILMELLRGKSVFSAEALSVLLFQLLAVLSNQLF